MPLSTRTAAAKQRSAATTPARPRDDDATPIPLERALPVGLLRAREAVMAHMRPILRAHGVTEQQWRVLRSLNDVSPLDKTTLTSRATLLMPSLLRILKDLKRAGLIRLVRSQTNRRLTGVILTTRGADYVEIVAAELAQKSAVLKQVIGEATVEELLQLLRIVELRLSAISGPDE